MIARLEGIEVRRHGRRDLDGVDLAVGPGQLAAVVGGDGAGKTTLLRVLVGVVRATAGTVQVPRRERIGYAAAGSGVYPDLTVEENLRFAAASYGVRGRHFEQRRRQLLEATDLGSARDRLASQLSGGMRQKLAFACVMLHGPELLVMDEPTTGVDPVSRSELWSLVSTAVAEGTAAVFSTTYVNEAARADHMLVLDRGRVLTAGAPERIRTTLPGRVIAVTADDVTADHPGLVTWRRGGERHAWLAGGAPPVGATPVEPDLEDAVIVAALAAATSAWPQVPA